jgi:hypothetical protein
MNSFPFLGVNQTGFSPIFLLIGILVLGLVGGGVYYWNQSKNSPSSETIQKQLPPTHTQSPDPTANWKAYTNNQLNFSFEYPPTWIIAPPGEGCCVTIYSNGATYPDKYLMVEADYGIKNQCEADKSYSREWKLREEQGNINNTPVTIFQGESNYQGILYDRKYLIIPTSQYCLRVDTFTKDDPATRAILDQILGTFEISS